MSLLPVEEKLRKQGDWYSVFHHPPSPGETVLLWSPLWEKRYPEMDDKHTIRVGYYSTKLQAFVVDLHHGGVVLYIDVPSSFHYIWSMWWRPIGELPNVKDQ